MGSAPSSDSFGTRRAADYSLRLARLSPPAVTSNLERAGGIGGLLARSHGYNSTTGCWSTHHYYHADGGGNVTALLDNHATSAALSASYRYDPYGRLISSSGSMAGVNLYRFSSKEFHSNSGLYYYGFRFYDPLLQRWINRDPIFERGGMNLYGFVINDPLNAIDPFGLADTSIHAACRNPYSARDVAKEFLEEVVKDQTRRNAERRAIKEAAQQFKASPRAARGQLGKALGPGEGPAHHIAALEARSQPLARKAAQGGFNWNGPNNGIRLPQSGHKGFQKWHRDYNDFLNKALEAAHKARPNTTPDEAAALLQRLVDLERQHLQSCIARGVLP